MGVVGSVVRLLWGFADGKAPLSLRCFLECGSEILPFGLQNAV